MGQIDIIRTIGEPAMLEQLAEECAELGHAALKLARILRRENITPVPEMAARKDLLEELADVQLCIQLVTVDAGAQLEVDRIMWDKKRRWEARLDAV